MHILRLRNEGDIEKNFYYMPRDVNEAYVVMQELAEALGFNTYQEYLQRCQSPFGRKEIQQKIQEWTD
jgi:hypothetical protein